MKVGLSREDAFCQTILLPLCRGGSGHLNLLLLIVPDCMNWPLYVRQQVPVMLTCQVSFGGRSVMDVGWACSTFAQLD